MFLFVFVCLFVRFVSPKRLNRLKNRKRRWIPSTKKLHATLHTNKMTATKNTKIHISPLLGRVGKNGKVFNEQPKLSKRVNVEEVFKTAICYKSS